MNFINISILLRQELNKLKCYQRVEVRRSGPTVYYRKGIKIWNTVCRGKKSGGGQRKGVKQIGGNSQFNKCAHITAPFSYSGPFYTLMAQETTYSFYTSCVKLSKRNASFISVALSPGCQIPGFPEPNSLWTPNPTVRMKERKEY